MKNSEEEYMDTGEKISNEIKKEFDELQTEYHAIYLKEKNIHKLYKELVDINTKIWNKIPYKLDRTNYIYKIMDDKIYRRNKGLYDR